ncbi:hypothetical protein CUMW_046350 [Citrus unshiu]|nr:hypothetical protein CUMW_046350 [Citrus unshiu]
MYFWGKTHGVRQPRYPWSDGPAYITQCPIKPGASFRQKIIFSEEEGTLWWHAHSEWSRATVHGAIIIQPRPGTAGYPFPEPNAEVPIILGEWWKQGVTEVRNELLRTGGLPAASDAFTINGQPGDLYPCSSSETFTLTVDEGKTYLLRIINAAMDEMLFFSIANHDLTVVGTDGAYTNPLTTSYITISPGQTLDVLFQANQNPNLYYMASSVYSTAVNLDFINNTTATAVLQYNGNYTPISSPPLPYLPSRNDTNSAFQFIGSLRSLANEDHPIDVPLDITSSIFSTVSLNTLPCENDNNSCEGPNGTRLAASLNNQSFVEPSSIAILEAYYDRINGVYGENFPDFPPYLFNFTADDLPMILQIPEQGTEVKVLDYDSAVEINFQGTNLVAGTSHPIHLHGYSFFVVGFGFGNFDEEKDPLNYNLIDPPLRTIVDVPISGWATVRFRASNPERRITPRKIATTTTRRASLHGVKQPRNPWGDEEGTIWWHAHSDWLRTTVHGDIVVYPKKGTYYHFPKPHDEMPIILDTFKLLMELGKTYNLLRMINAGLEDPFSFAVAKHELTIVGVDGSYTKPLSRIPDNFTRTNH